MIAPHLIKNATLINPQSSTSDVKDVLINKGKIVDIAANITPPDGATTTNAKGLCLAPGLIDISVMAGEPGFEHREDFVSASQAALAGGVTTILTHPATSPVADNPTTVDFIKRRARDVGLVNIFPLASITKGMEGEEMTEFGLLLEAGAIAFTEGHKTLPNTRLVRRALTYARDFDVPLLMHTEDTYLSAGGVMNEGELASRLGLSGRSKMAEVIALERDLRLVELTQGSYHAMTVTCAESVNAIRLAKQRGLNVTAGTTVNHVCLNENDIGAYRTFFKLSPPLRHENDRIALIEGIADGTIDILTSDHNPQDVETKRLPFAEAEDGAIGLETLFSAALRLVHAGHLTLQQLMRTLTTAPAARLKLPQGRLEKQAPADLILFDPELPWIVKTENLKSRCKNTPFENAKLQGQTVATWVNGQIRQSF